MKYFLSALWATALLVGTNTRAQVVPEHNSIPRPQPGRGRVQGTIQISDNAFAQRLQASGGKISIEVWRVNYAADKTDKMYSDIFLQQKINVAVAVQSDQTGLHYTIQNLPALSNLAVIAYAPNPSGNGEKLLGKPYDGQPASAGHQFRSDAKKYLGKNTVYGIYSLVGLPDDYTNINFRVSAPADPNCKRCALDVWGDLQNAVNDIEDAVTKVVNGVAHVFNLTIDGMSGLAQCVVSDIQGIPDAVNFYINSAGAYFYLTAAGLINLIEYGNFPRERPMTAEEYAWANIKMFNYTLPPINHIMIFNFMNLGDDHHRCFTWPAPTGNYIYVNIGDAYDNPMNYTNPGYPAPGQVFIHELTHAWQCGKYGFSGMTQRYFAAPGGMNQTYDPGCAVNNINSNYDLEQQATMVDRTYESIYFDMHDNYSCNYGLPWVIKNIRKGVAFDMGPVNAAKEMGKVAGVVGGEADGMTFHSNGNPTDGDGYFMVGRNNTSFLYYSNKNKVATANWGAIREKFIQANYEFGELGWPVRSEALLPDAIGYYQKFDHGFIYWHPKYGTYIIMDNIFDTWAKNGWEKGKLGYPVSDYITESPVGGYQKFVGGIIYYSRNAQPATTIRFGSPAAILAESRQSVGSTRHVNINPQPFPPVARKN